jgi:hypothetical protein
MIRVLIILSTTLVGLFLSIAATKGAFVRWKCIGTLPQQPVRILAGEVGSYPGGVPYQGRETGIYIETVSGSIYHYSSGAKNTLEETERSQVKEINFCHELEPDSSRHLEDELDNYEICWHGEWDWGSAHYAIRKDGTVWRWLSFGRFPDWLVVLLAGPLIGLLLGLAAAQLLLRRP